VGADCAGGVSAGGGGVRAEPAERVRNRYGTNA
jgi:hypothetical protein